MMLNTPGLPALGSLLAEACPPLGRIASAAYDDDKLGRSSGLSKDEYRATLWEHYTQTFGHRADYRVWRLLFKPLYLPASIVKAWGDPLRLAENGLESQEPGIVWGILAMLSGLLTGQANAVERGPLLALVDVCDRRMFAGLAPIGGGEAGCGIIKVLALDALQKTRWDTYGRMAPEEVRLYLPRLEKALQEVDPTWVPGNALSFEALRHERQHGQVIAPFIQDSELSLRIQRALFHVRQAVRNALTQSDTDAEALLRTAALFAFSAWRMARSLRIGEVKFRKDFCPRHPHFNLDKLWSDEMQALRRVSQAARDAGAYLLSAGLAHLLLRVIPDHTRHEPGFKDLGADVSFMIRQAGLEVDERFYRLRSLNTQAQHASYTASPAASTKDPEESLVENSRGVSPSGGPIAWRVLRDQAADPRWAAILQMYPADSQDPLRPLARLIFDAHGHRVSDCNILRCAYSLALEYGMIQRAAALLEHFAPTTAELIDFAHSIKRALQVMPFGMDVETHDKWQTILRQGWALVPDTAQVAASEALVIHEVLLGRYLTVVRDAGPAGAKLFAKKYYDPHPLAGPDEIRAAFDEIRAAFDASPRATRPGPATVTLERFHQFVQKAAGSALGSPVCASLVALAEDRWSLLATGGSGRWVHRSISMPNLLASAKASAKQIHALQRLWFRKPRPKMLIPWGQECTQLGRVLLEVVEELDPRARWLALALEPNLATLPWQDLIYAQGRRPGQEVVVSIIPSFSWAALSSARAASSRPGVSRPDVDPLLTLSNASDLTALRDTIRADRATLRRRCPSVAILLGHGTRTETGLPSVAAATRPLSLEDWLEVAEYRLNVVHSCFSGQVERHLLGDLGGLPGLVLGINCRLLCAPVAEVPLATARALHTCLLATDGPREFGLRYLAAVAQEPSVALYNLYGFANEPVA